MHIQFYQSYEPQGGTIFLPVFEDNQLSFMANHYNEKLSGLLLNALESSSFSGKLGESFVLPAMQGVIPHTIICMGVGAFKEFNHAIAIRLGAEIYKKYEQYAKCCDTLTIAVDAIRGGLENAELAALVGYGFALRSYAFSKYKTQRPKKKKEQDLKDVFISCDDPAEASVQFKEQDAVAQGIRFARDLMNEPGNVLYPESYAKTLKDLEEIGVEVEILGEKDLEKLGFNALLGVGRGSAKESQLVIMRWNGGDKEEAPIAFVGKGVTFDTGGISIKPSAKMEEMKFDMGGSAAVCGAIKALALREAKANVVGVVGLVENMPGGNAQRPGDIVKTLSGQTVEVLNTDAEGRLVLADALWYTQDRFKPKVMIDIATLTMAIIIALGSEYAGCFSNDDALVQALEEAGGESGENIWRLPLHKNYDRLIDSPIADMKNITNTGPAAGSITAGQFLQRFVNGVPWAHIDIAGTAWKSKPDPILGASPTSFGVRLFNAFIKKNYEK